MGKCIDEAAHAFLQRGAPMRKQSAEHPEHAKDLSQMFDIKVGQKLRNDAKGYHCSHSQGRQAATPVIAKLRTLHSLQSYNAWRMHQSVPYVTQGRCVHKGCPNLRKSKSRKRRRPYKNFMKCEEFSAKTGTNVYYCNDKKSKDIVMCHMRHHITHVE